MKVKMVGTGSAAPSLKRGAPCSLVSTKVGNILIDAGPSAVRRLLEFGYGVDDIDAVVLTHFHPDHTIDLATLLFACEHGEGRREKPLLLVGGRGMDRFYRRLSLLYPWVAPIGYDLSIKTVSIDTIRMGPVSISAVPVSHRKESIAVCIGDSDRRVVFSGDTDYSPVLVGLASGVDLLVAECTFAEAKVKGHLNMAALLRIVREAKPKGVIMSHLAPEWEGFCGRIPAPLVLGEDGMELDL